MFNFYIEKEKKEKKSSFHDSNHATSKATLRIMNCTDWNQVG